MACPPRTINPPSFKNWAKANETHDERREKTTHNKREFDAYIGIADTDHLFEAHQTPENRTYEDESVPLSQEEFEKLVDASDFKLRAEIRKEYEGGASKK